VCIDAVTGTISGLHGSPQKAVPKVSLLIEASLSAGLALTTAGPVLVVPFIPVPSASPLLPLYLSHASQIQVNLIPNRTSGKVTEQPPFADSAPVFADEGSSSVVYPTSLTFV
jgi:hypothetical protein